MDINKILVAKGRLRSGWRILVFFLISFPFFYFLTLVLWDQYLLRYIILFGSLLALSFLFAHYLDKRPTATIGFMFHSRWIKEYLLGVLIGLISVSILFFLELGLGHIEISLNHITFSLLKNIFVFAMLTTVFQSAFEELLFRGYIFQNFIEGANALIATAAVSVLFGVGHLLTPNASWMAALNLTAFGVLLALGYVCTKSLWLPSGLHFSWNFCMRNIFSLPVSGSESASTLFVVKQTGPVWMTGGDYGPEAGIPALILLIVACLFIYRWERIRAAPEMTRLWENHKE
jgi:membrane protease YdiL (CAAX protease family)